VVFPAVSVRVIVFPEYSASGNVLNVIIWLPVEDIVELEENPWDIVVVNVPISFVVNVKLGVVSFVYVEIWVVIEAVGAILSLRKVI